MDDTEKLDSALPLTDEEDGILIVVDRKHWQIRVYYEGSAETIKFASEVLEAAKDMLEKRIGSKKEEETDSKNLN